MTESQKNTLSGKVEISAEIAKKQALIKQLELTDLKAVHRKIGDYVLHNEIGRESLAEHFSAIESLDTEAKDRTNAEALLLRRNRLITDLGQTLCKYEVEDATIINLQEEAQNIQANIEKLEAEVSEIEQNVSGIDRMPFPAGAIAVIKEIRMEWYYASEAGEQIGPITEDQIKELTGSGEVTGSTPVWNESMDDWQELRTTAFATLIKKKPPSISPNPIAVPPPLATKNKPENDFEASFSRDPNKIYASNPPKSPHMCWLNLLWPGIAQIVFGQTTKGIVIAVAAIFLLVTIVGIFIWFPLTIVDAFMVGKVLKSGRSINCWQFFPTSSNTQT